MRSEVETWLSALPEVAIEAELTELRQEAQELERRIEVREQALSMKRALSAETGASDEDLAILFPIRQKPNGQGKRGRDAIRHIVATTDRREWSIPDMLAAIHERGWIGNTHSVQVNLSRMHRDGEFGKNGMGIYVVPDASAEDES